jgi:hypothetical protein
VLKHQFLTILGTIFEIFGSVALGAYVTRSRAGGMGLVGMVLTMLGYSLFLTWGGVSTFATPQQGQAVLAGIEEYHKLPDILANTLQSATIVVSALLGFVDNVLLGVAVWRSGILPKWAGALWAFAPVLMYILGLVYAMTIGAQVTPPTVPAGAVLLMISGAWIAWASCADPPPLRRRWSRQPNQGYDNQHLRVAVLAPRHGDLGLRPTDRERSPVVSTATEYQQPASSSSSLRRFLSRCPVAAIMVMPFTVTWIIFLPVVLQGRGLLALPIGISEGLALNVVVFAIASMLGVALPAFLVTAATGGKAGVRDLLRRCLRWRVGPRWYLIALFGLLVTILLGASVFLSLASLEALAQKWPLLFTLFLPEVLLPFLFIQIFEEAGWTGFMQHTIQSATGPCVPASWWRPPSS